VISLFWLDLQEGIGVRSAFDDASDIMPTLQAVLVALLSYQVYKETVATNLPAEH